MKQIIWKDLNLISIKNKVSTHLVKEGRLAEEGGRDRREQTEDGALGLLAELIEAARALVAVGAAAGSDECGWRLDRRRGLIVDGGGQLPPLGGGAGHQLVAPAAHGHQVVECASAAKCRDG